MSSLLLNWDLFPPETCPSGFRLHALLMTPHSFSSPRLVLAVLNAHKQAWNFLSTGQSCQHLQPTQTHQPFHMAIAPCPLLGWSRSQRAGVNRAFQRPLQGFMPPLQKMYSLPLLYPGDVPKPLYKVCSMAEPV
ncbi:uncharacterized [Tachysurus ichikawai]